MVMKTKLEMAHEWYMMQTRRNGCALVADAWKYADAMQAAADKREKEQQSEHVFEAIDEWQPDWSQAPEWATHFFCERDEDDQLNGYFAEDKRGISIDFDIQGFDGYGRACSCETFNYQGDWHNSLRKRPE